MKESEIKIKISLDENKVPEQIRWTAEGPSERDQKSEAVLISQDANNKTPCVLIFGQKNE